MCDFLISRNKFLRSLCVFLSFLLDLLTCLVELLCSWYFICHWKRSHSVHGWVFGCDRASLGFRGILVHHRLVGIHVLTVRSLHMTSIWLVHGELGVNLLLLLHISPLAYGRTLSWLPCLSDPILRLILRNESYFALLLCLVLVENNATILAQGYGVGWVFCRSHLFTDQDLVGWSCFISTGNTISTIWTRTLASNNVLLYHDISTGEHIVLFNI
jgi:hypothetical protein